MPDALKINDIFVAKDLHGKRFYAIHDAYKAGPGDIIETLAGFAVVEKVYHDIDGDIYNVLTELNTVYIATGIWQRKAGSVYDAT